MASTDLREQFNEDAARWILVGWYLGYPPGNCHLTEHGTWQISLSGMPFKHSRIILMAAEIARFGPDVYHKEDTVERYWALPLAPDACVIEPDHICADLGLTMPLETDVPEDEWADRAQAARSLYIQWADELWGNSTVKVMVERLRAELASREVFLGADIAYLLNDLYATLGPGGVEAPE